MRPVLLFIIIASLVGCAAHRRAPATAPLSSSRAATATAPLSSYGTAPVMSQPSIATRAVAAMAFSPVASAFIPPMNLDRAARQPGAYMGFESLTTTFSYVRMDDRQSNDGYDTYSRRSVSERVGVWVR